MAINDPNFIQTVLGKDSYKNLTEGKLQRELCGISHASARAGKYESTLHRVGRNAQRTTHLIGLLVTL